MLRLTAIGFTAPCPALGPRVLRRREWVPGEVLLEGDCARQDGFDAFNYVADLIVLLISEWGLFPLPKSELGRCGKRSLQPLLRYRLCVSAQRFVP
jgi:hypothetical protein